MTKLNEMAKEYTPVETKNIADLEKVSVEIDVDNKIVNEGKEGEFSYLFTVIEDVEYRVPKTVLKGLKTLLESMPETKYIRVLKSGSGKDTNYQVVPVNE